MRAQKVIGLQKENQAIQNRLGGSVLLPRCMLGKSFPPILLSLPADSPQPMTQSDLPEETEKNMKPDYLKAPVIGMRPQGMNRSTFGTAISPKAHGFRTLIEIPSHIPMPPEPPALAPGTTRRTRPWIFLSDLLQKLDIELTVQYQEISLAGITEGSIPAREAPSVIPFLSLKRILRGKKTYTTNREIFGRGLGSIM